ncbi:MAG: bacteriohemerythrin [Gammaproteobacteria bacterium]|nr:bacteriohemerythrin [Gammaproteobacteria bacterium]MDH5593345.1 bacteriohemerythrin [Gammaproteobacteria bacterium]MDH5613427.1 bacteriohemerythrin [Gammaproteobacteria bacterium]
MEWSDDFSVSISEIDDQHKIIIGLINEVDEAAHASEEHEKLAHVLSELIDYTKAHFAVEESLMRIFKYPGYDEHKQKHEKLIERVIHFQDQFNRGNTLVAKELHYFLQDWLIKHIQGTDREYTPFMNEHGIK